MSSDLNLDPKEEFRSGRTADASVPPGARQFPCKKCGGPLLFQPGTTQLQCPYCGTANDIPLEEAASDGGHLTEQDYLAALEEEDRRGAENTEAPAMSAVRCGNCGANTTITAERTAERCPYCGNPLSIQNRTVFRLNAQAVLPFVVDQDKALALYRKWLDSRWFAPSDFKRRATRGEAMNGIYMPYWTYDAATRTEYRGSRGDAYFVTRMVPVQQNGKTVMQPRQVREIRWSPAAGTVGVAFDDVLVPASSSLPEHLQRGLEPWRLDNLQPFRQEFLSGFVTETYQVSLKDGFTAAKGLMEPAIIGAIQRDIGGDEQRVDEKRSVYDKITFKHVLLPVWLSAYRYGGTTYRFMINAQTGEAAGDRPWSVVKIALAVAAGLAAAALVYWGMGDAGFVQVPSF